MNIIQLAELGLTQKQIAVNNCPSLEELCSYYLIRIDGSVKKGNPDVIRFLQAADNKDLVEFVQEVINPLRPIHKSNLRGNRQPVYKFHQIIEGFGSRFCGESNLKKHSLLPFIEGMEDIFLLALFAADGAILGSKRSIEVKLTSPQRIIEAAINILDKKGIKHNGAKLRGKSYILRFASKESVLKFFELIYSRLIVGERKYNKFISLVQDRYGLLLSGKGKRCF